MAMPRYSVADAKNSLPRLIDRARDGEEVIITRRGQPVAEIRPLAAQPVAPVGTTAWLFARTRARPKVDITSVELLDLLYESDQD
ncbi:MAG TPA: type II toxin-antitoxin system prevent-host-death family antitoxin [Stellaceae bacterium]|nr:type II toxin-antitoxin system prevent-host-death family antitoxin [Stellaceae bacterium]